MAAQHVAALVRDLRPAAQVWFLGAWGPSVRQEDVVRPLTDVYQRIMALPPGTSDAQLRPLCEALLPVTAAVLRVVPHMHAQMAAAQDDVPSMMRVFNQAAAGAYTLGAFLNSPVLGSSAVAASNGMLEAMQAGACVVEIGLAAAADAVNAMKRGGQLGSAAAATLRTRLPFLAGLLLRGVSQAPFPDSSPGGRALAELRRSAWGPEKLRDVAWLCMTTMATLLGQSGGEPWHLEGAAGKLLYALARDGGAGPRRVARIQTELFTKTQASLAALVVHRLLDAADGPDGGSAFDHRLWRLAFWLTCQAACILATGESRNSFADGAAELAAAAERAAALFLARIDGTRAGQVPAAVSEAAAAARLCCGAHVALLECAASSANQRTMRYALAQLEASRPLAPAVQLLRKLLCAVAAAGASQQSVQALLVSPTGTGGAAAADELLSTAYALQNQLIVSAARFATAGSAAAESPLPSTARELQHAEAGAIAAMAAVAESCLRCLADLPVLQRGMRVVLLHSSRGEAAGAAAAALPEALVRAANMGVATAVAVVQAFDFEPEHARGQSARPWERCFDACASLAASACKLAHLTAAQPQLRAALEGAGYAYDHLAGLKLALLPALTSIDMLGNRMAGRQLRRAQALSLAGLAALRAVVAAEGLTRANVDSAVHLLGFLLTLNDSGALLVAEGALDDFAAAVRGLLARGVVVDNPTVTLVLNACDQWGRLALLIVAQPWYEEMARDTMAPREESERIRPTVEQLKVHFAVITSALAALSDERRQLAEPGWQPFLGDDGGPTAAAAPEGLGPHIQLLCRLAAEQLGELPPPRGAPGSAEERQLLLEREAALATRACGSLACTDLRGASEAALPRGRKCSGCATLRFCDEACSKAAWRSHRAACRVLATQRRQQQQEQQ